MSVTDKNSKFFSSQNSRLTTIFLPSDEKCHSISRTLLSCYQRTANYNSLISTLEWPGNFTTALHSKAIGMTHLSLSWSTLPLSGFLPQNPADSGRDLVTRSRPLSGDKFVKCFMLQKTCDGVRFSVLRRRFSNISSSSPARSNHSLLREVTEDLLLP